MPTADAYSQVIQKMTSAQPSSFVPRGTFKPVTGYRSGGPHGLAPQFTGAKEVVEKWAAQGSNL